MAASRRSQRRLIGKSAAAATLNGEDQLGHLIRYPLQIVPGTVGDSREPHRRSCEPVSTSFCGL